MNSEHGDSPGGTGNRYVQLGRASGKPESRDAVGQRDITRVLLTRQIYPGKYDLSK
jgi:hypothetical protein